MTMRRRIAKRLARQYPTGYELVAHELQTMLAEARVLGVADADDLGVTLSLTPANAVLFAKWLSEHGPLHQRTP